MSNKLIDNKELMKDWDYEKNYDLNPNVITKTSSEKVWWKCSKCGYEWETAIINRYRGSGCYECRHKEMIETRIKNIIKRNGSFADKYPELLKEWDFEKNGNPASYSFGSNKKVWWKCEKGHSFQSPIARRCNSKIGCPYCSNVKLLKGFNDLETTNPLLAKEWNYEKNEKLTPKDVFEKGKQKVWWKCEKGHEWKAALYTRAIGIGCPICNNESQTSFPEQSIFYYLSKKYIVKNREKILKKEIDIFLPEYNIGIEYDGKYYHKGKMNKDKEKEAFLRSNGITLFRVKESDVDNYYDGNYTFYYKYNNLKLENLEDIIKSLIEKIEKVTQTRYEYEINLNKDRYFIQQQYIINKKENSILTKDSNLIKYWDTEKNAGINIEYVSYGTETLYWWKCDVCNNSWKRIPNRMIGKECPFCSGTIIKKGFNDFASLFPELLKEWDFEKNEKKPEEFAPNSNQNVSWKCEKGHEWQTSIYHRTQGSKCPICSNKKIVKGINDFETLRPDLAKEWNYSKNEILPSEITLNSNKRVWWICSKCGLEWEAYVGNRSRGNGCPHCNNKISAEIRNLNLIKKQGSLESNFPELMKEWDYEKNSDLDPKFLLSGCHKKVWWICSECGNNWLSYIYNRTKGHGCPKCSKKKK